MYVDTASGKQSPKVSILEGRLTSMENIELRVTRDSLGLQNAKLRRGESIARAAGLDERYVRRILQCAFLAPDIVESILEGRQPAQMTFDRFRQPVPAEWSEQRKLLGFPAK
jgi:hypothetical protein